MSKLNFEYLFNENKNLFKVNLENDSINYSKTLTLENLIKILQSLNNTVDNIDSGYLPRYLVRSVFSSVANKALFHFPSIVASPKITVNSYSKSSFNLFNKKYFNISAEENYTVFSDYKILNVILYLNYNKHTQGYNIMHLDTTGNLFGSQDLNNESKAFKCIFPNHFESSICWGDTHYGTEIHKNFNENNLNKLQDIPFIYFNSSFNTDLRTRNISISSLEAVIRSNRTLILEYISSVTGENSSEYEECFNYREFDLLVQFALLKPFLENETLYSKLCENISHPTSFKNLME